MSDNDLGSGGSSGGRLDERIGNFAALRTFRGRRSNIVEVPWNVIGASLDNLLVLDLSGNGLKFALLEYLPMTLKEIDLSSNNITRLSEKCVAEGGDDTDAADEFEPTIVLPNLISLDVSRNKLTALPSSMEVPALQTLRFGENSIASLPLDLIVQSSRALSTLEGQDNQLRSVPDLFGCKRLKIADFSDNVLIEVPAVNPSLVRLSLNNNSISSLSGLFSAAQIDSDTFRSDLTELRLRGNKLSELDEDIMRCCTKIALLDVGQNDLRDLPRVLGYLPALRRIALDGNALRVIRAPLASNTAALKEFLRKRGPPPAGPGYIAAGSDPAANGFDDDSTPLPTSNEARSIVNSALVGTFTLDLSGTKLDSLPDELKNELVSKSSSVPSGGTVGGQIKKLNVSKNSLKMLDDWVQVLPGLSCIDAAQNQIDSIPADIEDIELKELSLPRNRLTSLTLARSPICSIGNVTRSSLAMYLTHLDFSGNHLEWFPSGLSKLPALTSLVMSNNCLRTLEVGKNDGMNSGWRDGFKALETLNLSSNKLTDLGDLPRCLIECCPSLRNLFLQNNELPIIPPAFGVLRSLASFDCRGNPQRGIRMGVLDRSCTEILAYLRSRIDEADLRRMEAKMAEVASVNSSTAGSADAAEADESRKVQQLKEAIEDLTIQLNNVHLTEAKKYAMKKSLALHKANLIKEERRLRMQAGG